MQIKIIYGYCFPESTVYPTENGDVDGWTFTHIKIPDIFKNLGKTSLVVGSYNYHVAKGNTGTYVSLKDIQEGPGCTLPIQLDTLIKEDLVINQVPYYEFLCKCKLKNPTEYAPQYWVICNA